jgi:hypothetical protein
MLVPRIGITGHVWLDHGTDELVFDAVVAALYGYSGSDLHGVTCLAQGADQIFARAVLAMRGTFEVILPAEDYRDRVVAPGNRASFDDLLERAIAVRQLPYRRSDRPAYTAASVAMLDRCDMLIAVWDGQPSRKPGDTAHVVATAQQRRMPVTVLWPTGAVRR